MKETRYGVTVSFDIEIKEHESGITYNDENNYFGCTNDICDIIGTDRQAEEHSLDWSLASSSTTTDGYTVSYQCSTCTYSNSYELDPISNRTILDGTYIATIVGDPTCFDEIIYSYTHVTSDGTVLIVDTIGAGTYANHDFDVDYSTNAFFHWYQCSY